MYLRRCWSYSSCLRALPLPEEATVELKRPQPGFYQRAKAGTSVELVICADAKLAGGTLAWVNLISSV